MLLTSGIAASWPLAAERTQVILPESAMILRLSHWSWSLICQSCQVMLHADIFAVGTMHGLTLNTAWVHASMQQRHAICRYWGDELRH